MTIPAAFRTSTIAVAAAALLLLSACTEPKPSQPTRSSGERSAVETSKPASAESRRPPKYTSASESAFWKEVPSQAEQASVASITARLPKDLSEGEKRTFFVSRSGAPGGAKIKYVGPIGTVDVVVYATKGMRRDFADHAADYPAFVTTRDIHGFKGLEQERGSVDLGEAGTDDFPAVIAWDEPGLSYTVYGRECTLAELRTFVDRMF